MNKGEIELLIALIALNRTLLLAVDKKKRAKKRFWARSWLLNREKKGAYNNILQELRLTDEENFRKYLRMNNETFDELVRLVRP